MVPTELFCILGEVDSETLGYILLINPVTCFHISHFVAAHFPQ